MGWALKGLQLWGVGDEGGAIARMGTQPKPGAGAGNEDTGLKPLLDDHHKRTYRLWSPPPALTLPAKCTPDRSSVGPPASGYSPGC